MTAKKIAVEKFAQSWSGLTVEGNVRTSGFEKKKLSNISFSLCPGARRRFDAFVVKGFEMRKKHCCAETTCEEINAFDNLIKIQEIGL